ncbi:MAG: ABC transporter ATP-binding protein [Trueperaceae bacterium]|nr:ABC transporter ATP-binding protein [Trueperaceae bacterium]MCC6310342.1 ABC transporter ATP-binding protein [Trueperaceae bacterium]MCO5173488.1 ABC transporter ATP-binding protein [Trueperaceae bacterium]MCW5820252.1 ABC transporter ATP-binding protein [Trueperaceae bacterium]
MPEAPVIIDVQDVSKLFRVGKVEAVALQDANLQIHDGQFVSLIGPSGCGKTTLMRLVADLIEPTSGRITVAGKSPKEARAAREYGYVFQAPALYDWRNVLANVMLPLEIMGWPKGERRARAEEMLRLVGLEGFHRSYPWQLSGGMQQRVSIARALAFDPKLLLMDEPFGALDEITREVMNFELLRLWRQTGKTVVFVTHSIAEAVFLSSHIVVMTARPGRIREVIEVDLPYPRDHETRESERFFELTTRVREALRLGKEGEGDVGGAASGGGKAAGGPAKTLAKVGY